MVMLQKITIAQRIWILISMAVLGIGAIVVADLLEFKASMMQEKEIQTQKLVDTAHSILARQHALFLNGKIDEAEAKANALAEIKALRYDGENYFWVNDMDARMIMHPIKPKLDGKDLSSFEDPAGNKLFVEFVNVVKKEGKGSVPYLWPKPGSEQPVEKVSFVKGFQPWGWVIGTGVYIDDVNAAFRKSVVTTGSIAALSLIALLTLSFFIARSITVPLKNTRVALHNIAEGEGDLTQRLRVDGNDEVAKLSDDFNKFAEKIQRTMLQVKHASSQLATASEELSLVISRSNEGMIQQRNETHQVATAVTEMASTVKEIARSAESAAISASDADKETAKGKHVVEETSVAIRSLANEVEHASDVILRLEKEGDAIGSVLDVIRGIAEQTNLLALNAAIEAARAGEQGRGFAVVADEVRTLASRTQGSTREIQEMIERLQGGTREAVEVMENGKSISQASVEKAESAAAALKNITTSVASISDMNTQIASASEEQSVVAEEIDRSIVQISDLVEQASEESDKVSVSSQELAQLGNTMQAMIQQFKLA